jgi:hypothetical protein
MTLKSISASINQSSSCYDYSCGSEAIIKAKFLISNMKKNNIHHRETEDTEKEKIPFRVKLMPPFVGVAIDCFGR